MTRNHRLLLSLLTLLSSTIASKTNPTGYIRGLARWDFLASTRRCLVSSCTPAELIMSTGRAALIMLRGCAALASQAEATPVEVSTYTPR